MAIKIKSYHAAYDNTQHFLAYFWTSVNSVVFSCIIKDNNLYFWPFCVFTGKSERASFVGYERDSGASGCQVSFSSDVKFKLL